jgi:hypothetical protein
MHRDSGSWRDCRNTPEDFPMVTRTRIWIIIDPSLGHASCIASLWRRCRESSGAQTQHLYQATIGNKNDITRKKKKRCAAEKNAFLFFPLPPFFNFFLVVYVTASQVRLWMSTFGSRNAARRNATALYQEAQLHAAA